MARNPIGASTGHLRFRGRRIFPRCRIVGIIVIFGIFQVVLNGILFPGIDSKSNDDSSVKAQIENLQNQLFKLQSLRSTYVEDGNFYPFTIRDAQRLTPIQIDFNFHIFDYVDLHSASQLHTKNTKLVHNGHVINMAPCFRYSTKCYKEKILQVFQYVLDTNPNTQYFFYVESDNDLCVPLTEIRALAYRHQGYFLSTGVGFSGWIMSRQFVMDFIDEYGKERPKQEAENFVQPDPVGSYLLIQKKKWAVTRQYLVSHTILQSRGETSLTVSDDKNPKHLPRCLEPRRDKWKISRKDPRDKFGWDYFDYRACPESDIFPCADGQLDE